MPLFGKLHFLSVELCSSWSTLKSVFFFLVYIGHMLAANVYFVTFRYNDKDLAEDTWIWGIQKSLLYSDALVLPSFDVSFPLPKYCHFCSKPVLDERDTRLTLITNCCWTKENRSHYFRVPYYSYFKSLHLFWLIKKHSF